MLTLPAIFSQRPDGGTGPSVQNLYAATPVEQLVESEKPKDVAGLSPNDIARMEKEMESLSRDFRTIEEAHGQ